MDSPLGDELEAIRQHIRYALPPSRLYRSRVLAFALTTLAAICTCSNICIGDQVRWEASWKVCYVSHPT